MSTNDITCKICDSNNLIGFANINDFDLLKCRDCELIFVLGIDEPYLKSFYEKDYFDGKLAGFSSSDFTWDLHVSCKWICEKFLDVDRFRRYLEIGPGPHGGLIKYFHRKKDVHFLDISEYTTKQLRNNDLNAFAGTLNVFFDENKPVDPFDVIVAMDVIEHDLQPKDFVNSIYQNLASNGLFLFSTGNSSSFIAKHKKTNWYYFDPPAHVTYFNKRNIRMLLKNAGFRKVIVLLIGYRWIEVFIKYKISFLLPLLSKMNISTGMLVLAYK